MRDGAVAMAAWELQRAAFGLGFTREASVCNTVAAEQEVGPYYVAQELLRRDIREGKPGVPLLLRLAVLDVRTCKPLSGAAIDLWHCDALGLYAGYTKVNPSGPGPGEPPPPGVDPAHSGAPRGPGSPRWDGRPLDPQHPANHPGPPEGFGPPPPMKQTDPLTFLRGIQFTDGSGRTEFATVFPGFYMGRTNHVHFKVRQGGQVVRRAGMGANGETYVEGHACHTGQVFFPEEMAAEIMRHEPYAGHQIHRTTQAEDMVFQGQHGAPSIARIRLGDPHRSDAGYVAELIVAVDPTATPPAAGPGGQPGPGPRV